MYEEEKEFNETFESYAGKHEKIVIVGLIDKIVKSNKENPNREIIIVFNNVKYTDTHDMLKLKEYLKEAPTKYEVELEYNKHTIIYKAVINEVEK